MIFFFAFLWSREFIHPAILILIVRLNLIAQFNCTRSFSLRLMALAYSISQIYFYLYLSNILHSVHTWFFSEYNEINSFDRLGSVKKIRFHSLISNQSFRAGGSASTNDDFILRGGCSRKLEASVDPNDWRIRR